MEECEKKRQASSLYLRVCVREALFLSRPFPRGQRQHLRRKKNVVKVLNRTWRKVVLILSCCDLKETMGRGAQEEEEGGRGT